MAEQKRTPELKVAFDTSALFTGSASDLVNTAVAQLLTSYTSQSDVVLTWHLPSIVLHEREYQMFSQGLELLPPIQKLEKLLGHNLNITPDIIRMRIREAIQKQLQEFHLQTIDFRTEDVEWKALVNASLERHPPFEKGEKEKGFRDALIAECFLQLINESPSTPKYCRIALLTKDDLLASYLEERTRDNKNVKVFKDIKDLRGLINTLVSEVKEELIEKVQPKAQEYFFVPNQKETLYYTENVRDLITGKFKEQLEAKAPTSHSRKNGTWYISKPEFISKSGQRITWSTRIDIESKCYRRPQGTEATDPAATGLAGLTTASLLRNYLLETGDLVADGRTTFELVWSVVVSTNLKFRNPKIEDTRFVEINWEDKQGQ